MSEAAARPDTVVFIGGSRRARLNADVRQRIDRIAEQGFRVLVGDANGVDRAVQAHLAESDYAHVEVFCTGSTARNNVGGWSLRRVDPPKTGGRKNRAYYTAKDKVMVREATIGLVVWDGKSLGTLAQALRLVMQEKPVVIYRAGERSFTNLRSLADWTAFAATVDPKLREDVEASVAPEYPRTSLGSQLALGAMERSAK